jgi:hypothetical protein
MFIDGSELDKNLPNLSDLEAEITNRWWERGASLRACSHPGTATVRPSRSCPGAPASRWHQVQSSSMSGQLGLAQSSFVHGQLARRAV